MDQEREFLQERYELSVARVRDILKEDTVRNPYRDYFRKTAEFICLAETCRQKIKSGFLEKAEEEELRQMNQELYRDILPDHYDTSYGNPDYAAEKLGSYGAVLSSLYAEIRGIIVYIFEDRLFDLTVVLELFLEIYNMFEEEVPEEKYLRERIYWYVSDYSDRFLADRIRELVDPSCAFATDIIRTADLGDTRYLYRFGEYITENEKKTAEFLNGLSEQEIESMASTYTEGYRMGFELAGIDLSRKKTVNIRYVLGFERMIRAAILQFEKMGLQPTIYRSATHMISKRGERVGYYGAVPNPQFDFDHKADEALFLDEDFVQRKLRAAQVAYEQYRDLAGVHAGPAVMEVFGEIPFVPQVKQNTLHLSERQRKWKVSCDSEMNQITNRYIRGDERSFTIIAYPVPAIGKDYEAIFRETVKINTLDYMKYRTIQQKMIDALDRGRAVRIRGGEGNRTDLTVQLHVLQDPQRETNFENCVADVNIPVGEVFTSPVLKGTNGILHVTQVFLNDLNYRDLVLEFTDGRITGYHCGNFEDEEENRRLIQENLLFHHETLPLGEFAIGTNTTAYRMAKRYQIAEKLPILIAEKMGPHFAIGDTCYSWAEDNKVYNPDGKEIIARDNEISILRKEDPSKAYFGCHTDITIPYDELGDIWVEIPDEEPVFIIRDGEFVLQGTEELNLPLKQ